MLKIAVCVKKVPDTASQLVIRDDGLEKDSITWVMNPYDEFALEEAIRIKEDVGDASIKVFAIGDQKVDEIVRLSLAMGADEAEVLDDDQLYDLVDTTIEAKLFSAMLKEYSPDLVLTGKVEVDLNQGMLGLAIAEHLGIPCITSISEFKLNGEDVEIGRKGVSGWQVIEMSLPIVCTADKDLNTPRYPKLPAIMKAKRKSITRKKVADLTDESIDLADTTITIQTLDVPEGRKSGKKFEGDVEDSAKTVLDLLQTEAKLI